jgi:hypothetical protein
LTAKRKKALALEMKRNVKNYLCKECNRTFKRTRDLICHTQIMHKNIDLSTFSANDCLIVKTLPPPPVLQPPPPSTAFLPTLSKQTPLTKQQLIYLNRQQHELEAETKDNKVCFVCNKVFKDTKNSTSTSTKVRPSGSYLKSFIRHMQTQHGMSETGQKLIECPVCLKSFFNQQQLERHMHTHESWVTIKSDDILNESKEDEEQLNDSNDYRQAHSILYCHECIECSLFFKSIKVLRCHKLKKHNLRPVYSCANSDCAAEFELVSAFLSHATIHNQKNIICSRCKLKFTNRNLLRLHMKKQHYNRTKEVIIQDKLNCSQNFSIGKLS